MEDGTAAEVGDSMAAKDGDGVAAKLGTAWPPRLGTTWLWRLGALEPSLLQRAGTAQWLRLRTVMRPKRMLTVRIYCWVVCSLL